MANDFRRSDDRCLPNITGLVPGINSSPSHIRPVWPLSPPYSSTSEEFMKRARTSASPCSPEPSRKRQETEHAEMASRSPSPQGPSHTPNPLALLPPSRADRMSITNLISSEPAPRPTSGEVPLTYLPQDDLCVRQPFEVYLTYASALPRRREELDEIEKTLAEADSLVYDLGSELEKAENAKPRRARIIGPIRTKLQGAETQQSNASEKVGTARTRATFSANTMRAMQSVLLKFGWRVIETDGEHRLQPHPNHPAARGV